MGTTIAPFQHVRKALLGQCSRGGIDNTELWWRLRADINLPGRRGGRRPRVIGVVRRGHGSLGTDGRVGGQKRRLRDDCRHQMQELFCIAPSLLNLFDGCICPSTQLDRCSRQRAHGRGKSELLRIVLSAVGVPRHSIHPGRNIGLVVFFSTLDNYGWQPECCVISGHLLQYVQTTSLTQQSSNIQVKHP